MSLEFSVMFTGMHPMNCFVPWAQKLEQFGFDELVIADDLPYRPAWPILTMIAMNTSRIKVGPAIINPITAHPVYHATNLLALDELSGGRAICAMGKGAFNANLRLPEPEKPVRMIKEAYYIMKHVMAGNSHAFEGDYFNTAEGFRLEFEALRKDIPILIGSWGPLMSRMAGQHTAGLIAACCSGATMKRLADETRTGAINGGRDPSSVQIVAAPLSSISMDARAARRTMTELLPVLLPTMRVLTQPLGMSDDDVQAIFKAHQAGDMDSVEKMIPDHVIEAFSLTGTPEQVIPQIERLAEQGVTKVTFTPPIGPDVDGALDLIAKSIIPYFK